MIPENIKKLLIAETALVREALKKIEANQLGVIFITNEENQVLGIHGAPGIAPGPRERA